MALDPALAKAAQVRQLCGQLGVPVGAYQRAGKGLSSQIQRLRTAT